MPAPVDLSPSRRPPGRFRRVLESLGTAVSLVFVFTSATAAGIMLHIDRPPARRLISAGVNAVLAPLFTGRIVAEQIDHIGLRGIDIGSAVVVDAQGLEIIRATGIHARVDMVNLVRQLLATPGELRIILPFARVDDAVVIIAPSPTYGVAIAEVFALKAPTPPTAGARAVRFAIEHVEIGHAWVHGAIVPALGLDSDLNDVVGAVQTGPDGLSVDVDQTAIVDRVFLPARIVGTANYHLRIRPPPPGGTTASTPPAARMWADFDGHVGDVEAQARGILDGRLLTANAEIPRATPAAIATIVPGLPLREPVGATITIDGELPTFSVTARVSPEGSGHAGGSVLLDGRVEIAATTRLMADFDARDLDPAALTTIPSGPLNAAGRVNLETGPVLRIALDARTEPVLFAGQLVPGADLHAVLDRGVLSGIADIHEVGAPIDARFSLSPAGGLRFDAISDIAAIHGVPRIKGPVDGSAHVRVTGTLLGTALEAHVAGLFSGLRAPGSIQVGHGGIDGRIDGSIDVPAAIRIDTSVWGSNAHVAGYTFDHLTAHARGPVKSPHLDTALTGLGGDDNGVHASGELDTAAGAVRGIKLAVKRDGTMLEGTIARVGTKGGAIAIEGVSLGGAGIGKVRGSLAIQGRELSGKLQGEEVDLAHVSKLAGISPPVHGIADFDIDLMKTGRGRKGHVAVQLENGELSVVTGISASLNAQFDGDNVKADALVRLVAQASPEELKQGPAAPGEPQKEAPCNGVIAQVQLADGDGTLGGALLDPNAWAKISGKANVTAADWNIRCLARLTPAQLVLDRLGGMVTTRFAVDRARGARFPSIRDFFLRTRGFEVKVPELAGMPAWGTDQIDVKVTGGVDGVTGKAGIAVSVFDNNPLADVALDTELDLPLLMDDPKKRWASLKRSPFKLTATVPRRSVTGFDSLPTFLLRYVPPTDGDVALDLEAHDKLDSPVVHVHAAGWGVAYAPDRTNLIGSEWAFPLDVDVDATYDAAKTAIEAHVSRGKTEIASAKADVSADLREAIEGRAPTWAGGFEAKLTEFPLGEVPYLGDHDVSGHVSGTIAMAGLHGSVVEGAAAGAQPSLHVELVSPDLLVASDSDAENAKVTFDVERPKNAQPGDNRMTARAMLALADIKDPGRFDVNAHAGVRWESGLFPVLDYGAPASLFANAKSFGIDAFHPFVIGTLSRLDGTLDGFARLAWNKLSDGGRGQMTTRLKITDGLFNLPQIGQDFTRASVNITDAPGGFLHFDDFQAHGTRGTVTGYGKAQLDGLVFKRADATLTIKEGDDLPLTLEGVPYGNAWGNIVATADKREDPDTHRRSLVIELGIPTLNITLPLTSSRGVQALEDDPAIAISHPSGPPKEARSDDALRFLITLKLGDIAIAGTGIDAHVTGSATAPPRIELTDKTRISGDVQIVRGSFEVLGKRFDIEQGLVRLREEEAGNPYLNVTAYWDAPDGSRVFVDYVGTLQPVTNEKIKFRSSPPRSQAEILATLLLGDATTTTSSGTTLTTAPMQNNGTASTSGAAPAGGVALGVGGGLAAAQFNSLLQGITPLHNFSTRLTSDDDGTLKPALVYSLGSKVSAAASYEGAAPPGGTAAGRTARTQLTIDWRFLPNWSIRGLFGVGGDPSSQASSGVDLLWQYRY